MIKRIRNYFIEHIHVLIIVLPLVSLVFYGVLTNSVLKKNQTNYIKKEVKRYKQELKQMHKNQLKDKAKYIKSFIEFLKYENRKYYNFTDEMFANDVLSFIESVKSYKNGFIFIFRGDGMLIKHPCANSLFSTNQKNKDDLLQSFLKATNENKFIYYTEESCVEEKNLEKIAYVVKISHLDWYITINRNQSEIDDLVNIRKAIWKKKLDIELNNNIKLLITIGLLSFILSLLLSLFINKLIKKYKQEVKHTQETMLFQSRLAQAGELLNMIAHQWRHPISKIAAIVTNLRFEILSNNINNDDLDKSFSDIEKHTEFLSETIDDFKKFYKPKKVNKQIDIVETINIALSFLESSLNKKNIKVIDHFSNFKSKLLLNQNELIQVLMNIVQNAIDASTPGLSIEIIAKEIDNVCSISIKDEAGGIEQSIIEKIFDERFTTKVSSESEGGLGLGLYISKIIVEKHFGGKLEVISKNKSTTFIIIIEKDGDSYEKRI